MLSFTIMVAHFKYNLYFVALFDSLMFSVAGTLSKIQKSGLVRKDAKDKKLLLVID